MDPREFLDLASQLVTEPPKAVNLRTATNRAYYSAHHEGAEFLKKIGCTISTGPSGHGDVWNMLQNSGDEELTVAGSKLHDLYTSRIKADYRLEDRRAENQTNVRGHIAQAKKIVEAIERSCSGSKRQDIINAIKRWETLTRG
ncbi:hypothetical protein MELA_02723 [Candidatus Methylomirabilis lanthanidiphila]|uniref:HEPN domain-containing protein n=1 Tax=Candidatus Methylomirabilis lanthanidiphila TaxID=2211376 RepID=A0A564ZNT9_9BACT|nr:hypothetical protein [Candidatus Methylomirabilis lanthanidiphila]VUZ86322.1 hypothetical protein MELA_02723 [Candidatus Methylomirabilis lanthanidiphila]